LMKESGGGADGELITDIIPFKWASA
jgi:hypothetical protein